MVRLRSARPAPALPVKAEETAPRVPAILEDNAWAAWLSEDDSSPEAAKATLETMEGVSWQAAPELKKSKP